MDISDIRIFVKLAEVLNFAKTAEELYISPSTVTYSIKKTETELGKTLLIRDSHGVKLTKDGETFYHDMERLMQSWNIAESHLESNTKNKKVPFRIGLISMTLQEEFSDIIAQFMTANPEVQVSLEVCPIDDPSEPLRSGKHDVAFMYQDALRDYSTIKYKWLTSIPLYIVLNKNNPLVNKSALEVSDLCNQTIFAFPSSINNTLDALRRLGAQIKQIDENPPTTVVMNDHKYCMALTANNLGITFVPVFPPTLKLPENLVMRPFSGDAFRMQIGIGWKDEVRMDLIRSLIEISEEYFSQ